MTATLRSDAGQLFTFHNYNGPLVLSANPDTDLNANMNSHSINRYSTSGMVLAQDELKMLLKKQLEYYFSRQNLTHDSYLKSQMDRDNYVPIVKIAAFNKIKALTTDLNLVIIVLKESDEVEVDEYNLKVRPCNKRSVLILREISEDTPMTEVEGMFIGCDVTFISLEYAGNSSWYVTFDDAFDANIAFNYIRRDGYLFQNKPVQARIKSQPGVPTKSGKKVTPGAPPTLQQPQLMYPQASTSVPQGIMQPVPVSHPSTITNHPNMQASLANLAPVATHPVAPLVHPNAPVVHPSIGATVANSNQFSPNTAPSANQGRQFQFPVLAAPYNPSFHHIPPSYFGSYVPQWPAVTNHNPFYEQTAPLIPYFSASNLTNGYAQAPKIAHTVGAAMINNQRYMTPRRASPKSQHQQMFQRSQSMTTDFPVASLMVQPSHDNDMGVMSGGSMSVPSTPNMVGASLVMPDPSPEELDRRRQPRPERTPKAGQPTQVSLSALANKTQNNYHRPLRRHPNMRMDDGGQVAGHVVPQRPEPVNPPEMSSTAFPPLGREDGAVAVKTESLPASPTRLREPSPVVEVVVKIINTVDQLSDQFNEMSKPSYADMARTPKRQETDDVILVEPSSSLYNEKPACEVPPPSRRGGGRRMRGAIGRGGHPRN